MNEKLQDFARKELKRELPRCTESQIRLFKRMYSHGNPKLDIDAVIDGIPEDRLDRAMQQVARTTKREE